MIDRRGGLAWLGLSAAVIAIDQLAKWALIVALHPGDQRVVTGFFSLVLTFNTGAAFSFLRDAGDWARYLFSAVAIAAGLGLLRLMIW